MYNTRTLNRDIEWYNLQYETNRYSLSPWQRDDCWPSDYQKSLINSILNGIDIPKIYIGQIINTDIETIMDGGHRTRSINGFMNNNFSIKIEEQDVFYDKQIDQSTRNTRILNNAEKRRFLTFELTVTTYINITEKDCRMIFNILQNAQPMSVPDVINSHQSNLVDYLRHISNNYIIDGISLKDIIIQKKILKNVKNSELLYQLASWFTILNPILNGEDDVEEEIAMKYLEKGKTRDSKCLDYVKKYTDDITEDIKNNFEEMVIFLMEYPYLYKMNGSDINTLIHSKEWVSEFSEEKFNELLDSVTEYTTIKNKSNKKFKEGYVDEGSELMEEANVLDSNCDGKLSVWKNTKTSGGSNYSGMSKRKDIVEEYCCD